jgi:hypothetical protein
MGPIRRVSSSARLPVTADHRGIFICQTGALVDLVQGWPKAGRWADRDRNLTNTRP